MLTHILTALAAAGLGAILSLALLHRRQNRRRRFNIDALHNDARRTPAGMKAVDLRPPFEFDFDREPTPRRARHFFFKGRAD